jgi:hypothetical protein
MPILALTAYRYRTNVKSVSNVSCGGLIAYIQSRTGKKLFCLNFSLGRVGQDDSVEPFCFCKFYKNNNVTRILIQKLLSSSI